MESYHRGSMESYDRSRSCELEVYTGCSTDCTVEPGLHFSPPFFVAFTTALKKVHGKGECQFYSSLPLQSFSTWFPPVYPFQRFRARVKAERREGIVEPWRRSKKKSGGPGQPCKETPYPRHPAALREQGRLLNSIALLSIEGARTSAQQRRPRLCTFF